MKLFCTVTAVSLAIASSTFAACNAKHSAAAKQTINPSNVNQAVFAQAVLAETNAYRCSKKRKALAGDPALIKAAVMHSENMADQGKLSHTLNVRGEKSMKDRFKKAKVAKGGISAENIIYLFKIDVDSGPFGIKNQAACQFTHPQTKAVLPEYTYERLAARAVLNWSGSKGHRANMLNKRVGHLGAAAEFKSGGNLCGKWYITQTFSGK